MSTQTGLPAIVSILQLGSGTLTTATIFPASMTVAGVATTLGFPVSQLATTLGLQFGGGTGQILNKLGSADFSTQWSNITQFVAVGTGLATSGSATAIVAAFATQTGLSVLGVGSTATAVPAAIGPGTAAQVLVVNDAGTGVLFGQVNLASSAAVKGVLPGANYSSVNLAASGAGGVQGVLVLANGGTNTTTFTVEGVVFAVNATTLGATAAGTAGMLLTGNGSTVAPSFQSLNLGSALGTSVIGVSNGGTNTSTLTAFGVIYGNGTSTVGITAAGTTGWPLVGQGTAVAPSFAVLGVAGGGSGTATLTAHAVLLGEGAATLGFATIGTGGRLLIDQGAGNDPGFKAMSGDATIASSGAITCSLTNGSTIGTLDVLQNSQSAAYTAVLADDGKQIFHPVADGNPRTFTIPSNASVAFSTGATLTFINMTNTITIAINSDTLTMAGTNATGSRTLAAVGMATAIKVTSTQWVISGAGLS